MERIERIHVAEGFSLPLWKPEGFRYSVRVAFMRPADSLSFPATRAKNLSSNTRSDTFVILIRHSLAKITTTPMVIVIPPQFIGEQIWILPVVSTLEPFIVSACELPVVSIVELLAVSMV